MYASYKNIMEPMMLYLYLGGYKDMKTFNIIYAGLANSITKEDKVSDAVKSAFENAEKDNRQYVAVIDVRLLCPIAEHLLKKYGIVTEIQRELNHKKALESGASMVGQDADGLKAAERDARENDNSDVRCKIKVGHWTFIIAVSSKMIKYENGKPVAIRIPVTKKEIEKYASEFEIIDGQHRIFGMSDASLGRFLPADFLKYLVINQTCHILIDATPEEKRNVFLSANWYSTRVSTALSQDFLTANRLKDKNQLFAYDVVQALAKARVDMGDEIGKTNSPIFGNVNFGHDEGYFNAYQLAKGLSHKDNDLMDYYDSKIKGKKAKKYAEMENEAQEAVLMAAASDIAKIMYAWATLNASDAHCGTEAVFGSIKTSPKKAKKTFFETAVVEPDGATRVGGLAKSNAHYIFGTAVAVMKYADKRKMAHTVTNFRKVIELLYNKNGFVRLEENPFVGKGGHDVFGRAVEDSNMLVNDSQKFKALASKNKKAKNVVIMSATEHMKASGIVAHSTKKGCVA